MKITPVLLLPLVIAGAASLAQAQSYPSKPLRLIMGYPPGGSTDVLGRMVGRALSDAWSLSVVAENRPGAGGNIGATACIKAPPDGYTMCTVSPAQSVGPRLAANPAFDPLKDFSHVTQVVSMPLLLLVHPSLPVKNVTELIALAKRRPGQLNYASSGGGATPQLMMELLKQRAGVDIAFIVYKGTGGTQIVDQVSGRVEIAFNLAVGLIPFVKDGKLRAVAVSTAHRFPSLPDVPTLAESGLKGVEGSSWLGISMPAGVPRDIRERVSAEIAKAFKSPDIREKLLGMGGVAVGSTPDEATAFFRAESDKWYSVAKAANITVE